MPYTNFFLKLSVIVWILSGILLSGCGTGTSTSISENPSSDVVLEIGQLTPEYVDLIDRFVDIPEDRRNQLRQLARDVFERRVQSDERKMEEVNRRIEERK